MNDLMDAFEPRVEATAFADALALRAVVSDPLAKLAWRQVLDAVEGFTDGCLKRGLQGHALRRWEEDRDWLTLEQDHPFSLEWCLEAIRVKTRIRVSVSAVRQWARETASLDRGPGKRRPKIVPFDWMGLDRWDVAPSDGDAIAGSGDVLRGTP
jgi:hypothetical protein